MSFFLDNIGIIVSSLFGSGSLLMYFFERKKNQAHVKSAEADADGKEIDNGSRVVELYKSALDDLPNRYEERFQEVSKFFGEKEALLREQLNSIEESHNRKISLLEEENKRLESFYKKKNRLLEEEIKLKNQQVRDLKNQLKNKELEIKNLKKN